MGTFKATSQTYNANEVDQCVEAWIINRRGILSVNLITNAIEPYKAQEAQAGLPTPACTFLKPGSH